MKSYYLKKNKKESLLDFYLRHDFDLVPIQQGGKIPIEKEWTIKSHKNKKEWEEWLRTGINIGVKTGKISKTTILDIDTKTINEELFNLLKNYTGLLQESSQGFHYFFKYEEDLPKTRIDKFKLDIENDGGQVVIHPSKVSGIERKIIQQNDIPVMSKELKEFIVKNLNGNGNLISLKPKTEEKIKYVDLDFINEGNRTMFLMKYGGVLRKKLTSNQTEYVMDLANKNFLKPPLSNNEFRECVRSIDRYIKFDEQDIARKIVEYMSVVPDKEATERDIKEALNMQPIEIKQALSYLIKEEYVVKKRRTFYLIEKPLWKEEFMESGQEVQFVFPYFNDIAHFRNGDMIVIGGKTGEGKSHIAMNIVKRLIVQGIKPNYVSLESGSRFLVIAKQLGLVEGDFRWAIHYNPENVELEKNAFTIIDWLLPKDYANTDKLFEYFSRQLTKNGGILLIFVQLRSNGEFFAKDMIEFFPSFVAKFFYEDEAHRDRSYFIPTKIREAKTYSWKNNIPTVYDWETKELKRVDELQI